MAKRKSIQHRILANIAKSLNRELVDSSRGCAGCWTGLLMDAGPDDWFVKNLEVIEDNFIIHLDSDSRKHRKLVLKVESFSRN